MSSSSGQLEAVGLSRLLTELLLEKAGKLSIIDQTRLQLMSQHLRNTIPAPRHADLVEADQNHPRFHSTKRDCKTESEQDLSLAVEASVLIVVCFSYGIKGNFEDYGSCQYLISIVAVQLFRHSQPELASVACTAGFYC